MNVKPGMRAVVIADDFASVVGMECLVLPNFEMFDEVYCWEVEFKEAVPVLDLTDDGLWIPRGNRQRQVFIADSCLRPAIGSPVKEVTEEVTA